MTHRLSILRIGALAAIPLSLFAFGLNYNASKSNTGNICVHPTSVSEAQAAKILAEVDKGSQPPTEASVRAILTATGIKQGSFKSIIIEPNSSTHKFTILLLANPTDEKAARSAIAPAR